MSVEHAEVTPAALLGIGTGAVDVPDAPVVVVVGDGTPTAPAVLPVDLAAAQGGADARVVVAAAPEDLDVGLQGALAGVGAGWAVGRDALVRALQLGPTSEAELRWLLFNDGCEVVRAPGTVTATPDVAALGSGPVGTGHVLADRVPLPSLRSWELTEATVPTVTIVVHGDGADPAVTEPWPTSSRVPSEVLVVGAAGLPATGRIRGVPDVATAVEEARGALVWFVHADALADREAWARALRRFTDDRIAWVQVAYDLPGGISRSSRGLLLADRELGAPAFAVVRRRELRRRRAADLLDAFAATIAAERGTIVASHPVPVTTDVSTRPVPTLSALAAGAGALARDLVRDIRDVRDRARGTAGGTDADAGPVPGDEQDAGQRPSVGWVGFSGQGNFGDELVLRAGRQLLDGIDVLPGGEGTHGTVLGGGTLLNADRFYQRIAHRIDAPGLHRLVLGTGVVSPEVKGFSEELAGWDAFLRAGPVGVRGPHSAAHLRAWAQRELPDWHGEVEVLGDPALVVTADGIHAQDVDDGLVVLAPIGASDVGQVAADDERRQVELLVAVGRAAAADGRPVQVLTAHAGDDRVALALVRELGDVVDEVVTAHHDLDAGLRVVAAADVVVGARLHALVAAAAAGTTFLGLAYRPKVADFAASVGMQDRVAPIEAWSAEDLVASMREGSGADRHEAMLAAVEGHRRALRERAASWLDEL